MLISEQVSALPEESCNTDDCTVKCDPGWQAFNGSCYFWSQEKLFWGAAEEKCRELGGHLASVTSEDVHNFLHLNVRQIFAKYHFTML